MKFLINPPRISVIIPTLNEEKYLDITLFHISRQNPYEIIIADSYSTDNTLKIAEKYGCKAVHCKRGSPSIGRNAGGNAAKGDVLLFIDADTIAFPNLLDIVRKDFRKKKVVGWTCNIYAFSPKWKEHLIYSGNNNLIEFLIRYAKKPHAPGIVISARKDVFKNVGGFDENLKMMEDHDFALKIGKEGKFIFSKETCVYTSSRRVKKWGVLNFIKKYSKTYISYMVNRKKFYKNVHRIRYEPVR
ncbi:MAG: glycosyltransferase [Candidatus Aenigmarchaeota archaeon]|nr:glycosyltransferase [Candidatus Aenigmarchaeota archaeon]MDI6722485.1 glycosyltransferase [Candidatus Aenigmarchaeota archaeon]